MLLLAAGDSKSEFVSKFVVGVVGSPPPGIESVASLPSVRLWALSISPGWMVIVAGAVGLIVTSVVAVGTPLLQLDAWLQLPLPPSHAVVESICRDSRHSNLRMCNFVSM